MIDVSANPLAVYPGSTPNPSCVANPAGTQVSTRSQEQRQGVGAGSQCRVRTCEQQRIVYLCPGGVPPVAGPWTDISCDSWATWSCGDPIGECRASPVSTSTELRSESTSITFTSGLFAGQCAERECDEERTRYECLPPQAALHDPWLPTGTCTSWRFTVCSVQPPSVCGTTDIQTRSCPSDSVVSQTRSRPLVTDGDPCLWGSWSDWSPECPAVVCVPPLERETQACPDSSNVEQSRERAQVEQTGSCRWQAWSAWTPACPAPIVCLGSETETSPCPTDSSVERTRTRDRMLIGASCGFGPWSAWSGTCPAIPVCDRTERDTQACASDPMVQQSRARTERLQGNVCVWNAWSVWAPQSCPVVVPDCDRTERETQACVINPTVQQSRVRTERLQGDVCVWNAWSVWTPQSCPVVVLACDRSETETQVCESDPTVQQNRARTERLEGNSCVWNAWSEWDPSCPLSDVQSQSAPVVRCTNTRLFRGHPSNPQDGAAYGCDLSWNSVPGATGYWIQVSVPNIVGQGIFSVWYCGDPWLDDIYGCYRKSRDIFHHNYRGHHAPFGDIGNVTSFVRAPLYSSHSNSRFDAVYKYRVRAYSPDSEGSWSSPVGAAPGDRMSVCMAAGYKEKLCRRRL